MNSITCPECQTECPIAANFCGGCGARLMQKCAGCQSENSLSSKFCSHCGATLAAEATKQDPGQAERRQLTVMFCDLVGSTELSAQLDPERYRNCLRRFQHEVSEAVNQYQGHIAQYLGDGLLVYFGYPLSFEDSAERAIRASMDITQRIAALRNEFTEVFGTAIEVRIGVHTGPVIVGDIGSLGNTEQLATGVTPNIAARLQGLAAPGSVVVSEATHSLVRTAFDFESLGERELRGVTGLMRIYQPVAVSRTDVNPTHHQTPFVGRDKELNRILQSAGRARTEKGQVIVVRGEPGIGKTRLRDEVWSRLQGDTSAWVRCVCSAFHTSTPLFPVSDFIDRWLDYPPRDDVETVRERLKEAVRVLPSSHPDLQDVLETVIGLSPDKAAGSIRGASDVRERMLQVLVDFVVRLAGEGLAVIEFEDVQWADATSLELLDRLVRACSRHAVLVLVTARPQFEPPWSEQDGLQLIDLDRLDEEAVAQMLATWEWGEALTPQQRIDVAAHTDGVPLFLEEFTKYLSDQAARKQSGVPLSLSDSLTARIDGLGQDKHLLQIAALIGRDFSRELLVAVDGRNLLDINQKLVAAVDTGLLVRSGTGESSRFSFKHALIQDAAYESLLQSDRAVMHGRIAETLLAGFPELVQMHPETVGRHLEGAARYAEAREYYQIAAKSASMRRAFAEAVLDYEKTLTMLGHLPEDEARNKQELSLLLQLSHQLFALKGYTDPMLPELYARAQALIQPMNNRVNEMALVGNVWGFHSVRGDYEEAVQAAQRIRVVAGNDSSDFEMASVTFVQGNTAFYSGDITTAEKHYRSVVDYIKTNRLHESVDGLNQALFIGWIQLPWVLAIAGHIDEAHAEIEQLQGIARDIGDPLRWSQTLTHSIAALQNTGGYGIQGIRALSEELDSVVKEHQLGTEFWYAEVYRSWAQAIAGDEAQIDVLRQAHQGLMETGAKVISSRVNNMLAEVCLQAGRLDEAMVAVDEAIRWGTTALGRQYVAKSMKLKGDVLLQDGQSLKALNMYRAAQNMAIRQGARLFYLQAATAIAEVQAGSAGQNNAARSLREAYSWFKQGFDSPHLIHAREVLDRLD